MNDLTTLFLATLDRTYLDQVREGFRGLGYSSDNVYWALLTLAAVATVLVITLLANFLTKRSKSNSLPHFWILNKAKIHGLLNAALVERSRFDMKFQPANAQKKATYCALEEVHNDYLDFELSPHINPSRQWIDKQVEFFFKVHEKKIPTFYLLQSVILGVKKMDSGITYIQVEFPKKLEIQQKRTALRLKPPKQYLLGSAIWLPPFVPQTEHETFYKKWGRPSFIYVPDAPVNSMKIENLSAGGTRLLIARQALSKTNIHLEIAQKTFMLLDLYDPETAVKQRYWLKGTVRNLYEDFETKNTELGVQFDAWGRVKTPNSHELEWTSLEDEGVEPLGNWVMRRHLELFRDHDTETISGI